MYLCSYMYTICCALNVPEYLEYTSLDMISKLRFDELNKERLVYKSKCMNLCIGVYVYEFIYVHICIPYVVR
jgi:hypothetical protein